MNYNEFEKSILNKDYKSVYLFEGAESFFARLALNHIKPQISYPDINFTNFEQPYELTKIITACNSFPFLSEKRVVVVKDFNPKEEELKKSGFLNYLKSPAQSTILMLFCVKAAASLKKYESVAVVDIKQNDGAFIYTFIKKTANENNIKISPDAVNLISEYCGGDLYKINGELQKLTGYCADKGVIETGDVKLLVLKSADYQVYEFTNALTKDNGNAYAVYQSLKEKQPLQIVFVTVYNFFKRMLYASLTNEDNATVASYLNVHEYAVKMARQEAKKFTKAQLKSFVEMLAAVDADCKSGKKNIKNMLDCAVMQIIAKEM